MKNTLKKTPTSQGIFNLYLKVHETEHRASVGVSIVVNENIPQSAVTLFNIYVSYKLSLLKSQLIKLTLMFSLFASSQSLQFQS